MEDQLWQAGGFSVARKPAAGPVQRSTSGHLPEFSQPVFLVCNKMLLLKWDRVWESAMSTKNPKPGMFDLCSRKAWDSSGEIQQKGKLPNLPPGCLPPPSSTRGAELLLEVCIQFH